MSTQNLLSKAVSFHQAGRFMEAEHLYRKILELQPSDFTANHLLGVLQFQQGRNKEALSLICAALRVAPKSADALSNCGLVLKSMGRLEEALVRFDLALEIKSDYFEAWNNRGGVLSNLGRFDEALDSCNRAIAIFDKIRTTVNRQHYSNLLENRGIALNGLRRFDEALASFDSALTVAPDYAEAWNNRGSVLLNMKRSEDALANFEKALVLDPGNLSALCNYGTTLSTLNRFEESFAVYERLLAICPDHPRAFGGLFSSALHMCDWESTTKLIPELEKRIATDTSIIEPFLVLACSSDGSLLRRCAGNYVRRQIPVRARSVCHALPYCHDRIRIAYLSADFHQHATAFLITELIERHDRSKFEVHAISIGKDDGSAMRKRLVRAFDYFHDGFDKSDYEIARLIRSREVDILIDLKGHTNNARLEILSHRPAPVQVNYLGYPGTTGAEFIDYILADPIVVALNEQPFFSEKIVQLPDTYQVNDSRRFVPKALPSRTENGLADAEIVFCNFNQSYKLSSEIFAIWLRLLKQTEGSVMWLLESNVVVPTCLRRVAEKNGVAGERLVFAPKIEPEDHLARLQLADLFLDSLPYNAHTTASDALWAGVPLLTCRGKSFAGRVAASLLHAIGLPELVTENLEQYETLALKLAADRSLLWSIREKLARNRLSTALFDTERFRRNIESAFRTMWERSQRGESPQSFRVAG